MATCVVCSRNIRRPERLENTEPGGEWLQVLSLEAAHAQSLLVLVMMVEVLVLEEELLRV